MIVLMEELPLTTLALWLGAATFFALLVGLVFDSLPPKVPPHDGRWL